MRPNGLIASPNSAEKDKIIFLRQVVKKNLLHLFNAKNHLFIILFAISLLNFRVNIGTVSVNKETATKRCMLLSAIHSLDFVWSLY